MAPAQHRLQSLIPSNTAAIIIGIVLGLAAIQVVFEFLARDIARQKISTIHSYLNDTRTVSNPYLISQRIEDMEAMGSVRCSVFKPADHPQDFINLSYKTGCDASYSPLRELLLFKFKRADSMLLGIDGRTWSLSFRSMHSGYFQTGLWLTRLAFVLFVILVAYFTNKTLSLRVRAFEVERQLNNKIVSLAVQVAHDIRSPVFALEAALKNIPQLPERQRVVVRHAVNSIRDVANSLLEKNRAQAVAAGAAGTGEAEGYLLSSLLDPVVTEKRLQFETKPGVNIDFELSRESYGLFAKVQPVEFRRMVSNLVNNAVEAGDNGKVSVGLVQKDEAIILTVSDTGKGIPPEILAKLGQRGETHGKAGGSGLGLYHARTTAENWGGSLAITSEVGKGTTVAVTLPKAKAPAYFVGELKLLPGRPVLVLDDEPGIHEMWRGRFEAARLGGHKIETLYFSEPGQLRAWVKENAEKAAKAVCLFDYELAGHQETGLTLAEELGLCEQTILVTSRSEEQRVIEACAALKVRMIPKAQADLVPVSVAVQAPPARAVLLDDSNIVHMTWEMAAEEAGVELLGYTDPDKFMADLGNFPKDMPIYIDSELGENIKGEKIAVELKEKGYTNLCLATAHAPERFAHLPWLKVIDKSAPWGDDTAG